MKASSNESKKARKTDQVEIKNMKESEELVGGTNACKRLGRHRVDRLVLCNAQRIFVADQGLGVQFE